MTDSPQIAIASEKLAQTARPYRFSVDGFSRYAPNQVIVQADSRACKPTFV